MGKVKNRYCHIDMAKGVLISLVVLGHMLSDCFLNTVIFWFHVPAFFIFSGVFLKEHGVDMKEEIRKKWKGLLLPYFCYSIVLGTIAREGNFIKQVFGTLIGAGGNITSFTFCYYFVTALFLSVMVFHLLNRWVTSRWRWMVVGVIYLFMQVWCRVVPESILNFVPWNADLGMYALVFLYIGYCLSDKIKQGSPQKQANRYHQLGVCHYRNVSISPYLRLQI